ncbi:biotin-dependent carboxyltransferase family protein [Bacillus sp. FJAT-42376]|uniref:5-oxoprolinase subunit C family protein n=1 Tax=Bacillus sp. FJAT-42376 TaxID=2014076 RepID=UPI000F504A5C|nr:biotin-dependent carboxyltransferase family protein [Bacillus sp. FJAT-42376]AZB43930.1 biotin-dependent carboxyltransferase family protein [Bacillus sp. FJAT-42376]
MSLKILQSGLHSTIQDMGRSGYQKYGVIKSGAMDLYAHRLANVLTGNSEDEATIEMTLLGPTIEFTEDTVIALTGGNLSPKISGKPIPLWRPVYVKAGAKLEFGAPVSGCRTYMAAAGGYDLEPEMGSFSTYLKAGIGGFHGRALKVNDELRIKNSDLLDKAEFKDTDDLAISAGWYMKPFYNPDNKTIKYIKGREYDWFTEDSQTAFEKEEFSLSSQSDRMGFRLDGPVLTLKEKRELLSEAVGFGTIQVPAGGQPIILMADHQTTGGYPKIGQVIADCLPALAQLKPGEKIRFEETTVEEAQILLVKREKEIEFLRSMVKDKFERGVL